MPVEPAIDAVRSVARPFEHGRDAIGPLVEAMGDAHVALIGEASHGAHEFYRRRTDLAAALLERGLDIVAVEADWPDAARASRWVRLQSDEADAAAPGGFVRFQRSMWRNDDVVDVHSYGYTPSGCPSRARIR